MGSILGVVARHRKEAKMADVQPEEGRRFVSYSLVLAAEFQYASTRARNVA